MTQCRNCDCDINNGDKFGKIAFFTNDIFDGFGLYCYPCSVYYIKDFEQNEKWEIYNPELLEKIK